VQLLDVRKPTQLVGSDHFLLESLVFLSHDSRMVASLPALHCQVHCGDVLCLSCLRIWSSCLLFAVAHASGFWMLRTTR
jgi:hypothetical protein